jgi:hypothetical protein
MTSLSEGITEAFHPKAWEFTVLSGTPEREGTGSTPAREASCTRRRGPQSGLRLRASSTQTSTAGAIWCEHLGGRWERSTEFSQPLVLVPTQPSVHRLA